MSTRGLRAAVVNEYRLVSCYNGAPTGRSLLSNNGSTKLPTRVILTRDVLWLCRFLFMALEEEITGLKGGIGGARSGRLAERIRQLFAGRLVNYVEVW